MTDQNQLKAVILLSGGLDSATTLAIALSEGFNCSALTFNYGQRHKTELKNAKKIAKHYNLKDHTIINIDPACLAGSALTDEKIHVPDQGLQTDRIPATYVPARNLIFLSYATALAEVISAFDIFIGVNALDYSGYPDCRPEFIQSFCRTANLATAASIENKGRYKIQTPIIDKTKAQIIKIGTQLGVDYSLTHSCYNPADNGYACGKCDSCRLRLKGFSEAGIKDPVSYVN